VEALETHRPDIVVFCSPNNPTGALESTASIVAALEAAPLVIVDEAYVEFAAQGSSLLAQRERHPNLVVTRSFSKAWSMAGVRLGYLVADAGVVSEMARVRLPYSLSTFSQLMGVAALRHADEARSAISSILVERNRIATGLAQLGVGTFPTDANFVLFELEDEGEGARTRAEKIWRGLLEREVLVRNYSSSPALAACLRVTASSAEDTDAFLEALEEVL
jgi:histidinol-phosphate aminotransferase